MYEYHHLKAIFETSYSVPNQHAKCQKPAIIFTAVAENRGVKKMRILKEFEESIDPTDFRQIMTWWSEICAFRAQKLDGVSQKAGLTAKPKLRLNSASPV